MPRKTINLPTTQEIEKLYDEGNIAKLREFNERLAKTANQRMAQLFQSGIKSSAALERAQDYIYYQSDIQTGGVFSRSKKIKAEQLVEQIKEELIFLRSSSSTVTGEKEIRALKSFETLTEGKRDEKGKLISGPYMEIPKDVRVPKSWKGTDNEYFRQKFLNFLSQDAWKDIKKYLYTNEDDSLLKEAGEAIARGARVSDLNKAFRDYLKGEVDIYTMWDNWVSIK